MMNSTCPECGLSISLTVPCGEIDGIWYCGSCYTGNIGDLEPPTEEEIALSEQISALIRRKKALEEARYWKN